MIQSIILMMKRKVEAGVEGIMDIKIAQIVESFNASSSAKVAETFCFGYHFCIHRAYGLILCKKYSMAAKDLEDA